MEEKIYDEFNDFFEDRYFGEVECAVVAEWPTPNAENQIVTIHTKDSHVYLNTVKVRIAKGTVGVTTLD